MTALSSFIDIHCHILPGIDDGPKNLAESAAMARCYVESGIRTVIATPHYIIGTAWAADAARVRAGVAELGAYLEEQQIPLTVHAGMEIAYHAHILERIQQGKLLPLAGSNHYLLEPSFTEGQENLLATIKELFRLGKRVIIAHGERIHAFQKNAGPLLRLVEQGLEVQVNIGSLLDAFDPHCQQTGLKLLAAGAVHYLASDAHSATRRRPPTDADWERLQALLDSETLTRLATTHPSQLLCPQ